MDDEILDDIEESSVTADALFALLAQPRRRVALYYLERFQTPLTLADLADEVTLHESDEQSLAQIPDEDVKEVYMDLYHTQIPRMEAANLVEYNQERDTIRLTYDLAGLHLDEYI